MLFTIILPLLFYSGLTIQELGKDTIQHTKAERATDKFIKELDEVETELTRQINYLGQVNITPC